ncbi:MAG: saccharopine dehydrogenase NADP-binding domain-containing protein [Actinomycetota bacterium]
MAAPPQTAPIAVYGATGFTGKLVARELLRREANFVISGRNAQKLEALSTELGGVPTRVASVDDPSALRGLLEPCAAVIACAGPFTLHGEPVLEAAADTGTHYIDTTGEQPFMQLVFDRYATRAAHSGAALVTAMGFDYMPGDLIAHLTAEDMGPLDEATLAYWVRGFGATRGTALSALEILKGGDHEYRDGRLQPGSQKVNRGTFRFPSPVGEQRMVRYPAGEPITVPRHVDTRNVRMLLSASAVAPRRLAPLLPLGIPSLGLAMRTPLRKAAEAAIRRLPEGPSEADRAKTRWMIVCEAQVGGRTRRGTVTGPDPYGLTAVTTVHGAVLAAEPSFDRSGALAPAQAFDAASFLDALAGFGVDYEVGALPEPAQAAATR